MYNPVALPHSCFPWSALVQADYFCLYEVHFDELNHPCFCSLLHPKLGQKAGTPILLIIPTPIHLEGVYWIYPNGKTEIQI